MKSQKSREIPILGKTTWEGLRFYKKKFRALPVHPDPEIRISGFKDQEPPGDTWKHPIPPKKIILTKIIYGLQLLLQKNFGATHPTRGSLSKIGTDWDVLRNVMQIKLPLIRPTVKNDVLEFPFQKSRFQFLRKRN